MTREEQRKIKLAKALVKKQDRENKKMDSQELRNWDKSLQRWKDTGALIEN